MSAPVCPRCDAAAAAHDRYCAFCGEPLARVAWSAAGGDHRTGGGSVPIGAQTQSVRLVLHNDGAVAVDVAPHADAHVGLPDWIDARSIAGLAAHLPPGTRQVVDLPLVPSALEPLFEMQALERLGGGLIETTLVLVTSVPEVAGAEIAFRTLRVQLIIAREPWLHPRGAYYPFLAVEHVRAGRRAHVVELHNDTPETLTIDGVEVGDDPRPAPPGAVEIAATSVLRPDASCDGATLAPGGRRVLRFDLQLPARFAGDVATFFSGRVRVACSAAGGRRSTLHALVQGVLGGAPAVRCEPGRQFHPRVLDAQAHTFELFNPGVVPVRIHGCEVLAGDGRPVAGRDWLTICDAVAGQTLAAGERRAIRYTLDPAFRPDAERDQAVCRRTVRLTHDGDGAVTELGVEGELGAVAVAHDLYLGVDFGTSNSTACVAAVEGLVALDLETPDVAPPRDQMPSLMYYDGAVDRRSPFLFGVDARSSAAINPANVVRSIKSVVARQADAEHHFRLRDGERWQHVPYRTQALLEEFFVELRERAQRSLGRLSPMQRSDLGIEGVRTELRHVVLAHPVETSKAMRAALYAAARDARLVSDELDEGAFFERMCIDEATACVLAYVHARVTGQVAETHAPVDEERVVAVDVGGGTTDVATVRVAGIASYLDNAQAQVDVRLEFVTGDARFGGDDIDLAIARSVIDALAAAVAPSAAPLATADLEAAVECSTFSHFEIVASSRGLPDTEAKALFEMGVRVLSDAERAKRELTVRPRVALEYPAALLPREGGRRVETGELIRVELDAGAVDDALRQMMRQRLPLLDTAVRRAGWSWPEVTTLLLTGQSNRHPVLQQVVRAHVDERRGPGAPSLIVVAPSEGTAFCPKKCVAAGAAIWGASHLHGGWIRIDRTLSKMLPFDLQVPSGPGRFRVVPGLERGAALPATAQVTRPVGMATYTLYRDNRPYVRFTGLLPASVLTVRVDEPGEIVLVAGDREIRGDLV